MAARPRNAIMPEAQAVPSSQHPPKLVPIPQFYHTPSLETTPPLPLPLLQASHSHPRQCRWPEFSEFSLSTNQCSVNERPIYHAIRHPCYCQSPLPSDLAPGQPFEFVHSQLSPAEPRHDSHQLYETYSPAFSTCKPLAIMSPQVYTKAPLHERIHDSLQYEDFMLFPCPPSVEGSRIRPSADPPRAPRIPRLPTPVIGCPQRNTAGLFMGCDRPNYGCSDKACNSGEEEDRVLYLPPARNVCGVRPGKVVDMEYQGWAGSRWAA